MPGKKYMGNKSKSMMGGSRMPAGDMMKGGKMMSGMGGSKPRKDMKMGKMRKGMK